MQVKERVNLTLKYVLKTAEPQTALQQSKNG